MVPKQLWKYKLNDKLSKSSKKSFKMKKVVSYKNQIYIACSKVGKNNTIKHLSLCYIDTKK